MKCLKLNVPMYKSFIHTESNIQTLVTLIYMIILFAKEGCVNALS